ncbi:nucleotidyl transferase AbiEii/AbiGii toxin family protein, partial [Patescibacteria group bacterium]|nr:nucleotidyl transferase AbiEii/AbiGii toxin family protein [Patescibacteria group bacterium]
EDTLNCNLNGVKLSFFEYPYKNLFPFEKYNKIRLADLRDIACMKINAISSRGSKKDFIDLYFILQKILLDNLLKLFDKKYKDIEYNHLHILKSLTYFDEAEKQPSPIMLEKVSWSDIKQEIDKKVKKCLK